MSELSKSFRPPWAVTCWVDDEAVYIEVPMSPIPYIQKHSLTDNGLHKALNVLRVIHREAPGKWEAPKDSPVRKVVKGKTLRSTKEQREQARLVLRKLGLIP